MICHTYWRRAIFCVAVCALCTAAASAQDKVHLQSGHAVGDVSDNEGVVEMKLTMQVSADGHPLPVTTSGNHIHQKYQESALAVGADGRPTTLVRSYTMAQEVDIETGKPDKQVTASLEGKMVTVQRDGDKVSVQAATGTVDAKDRKDLVDALTPIFDAIYPAHDLTVGETWTVNSAALARSFRGADQTTFTGKLLEVVPYAGHRCAHLQITLAVLTPLTGSPEKMHMDLSGDLYHALDLQRPLAMVVSGPINLKSSSKQDGHDITFIGTGTLKMQMTANWLRIADKAP